MKAPDSQIAVTLFNLREYCQTESDLDRSLDKVCEIGFRAVQVSGLPLDAAVVRKQLDKHDLFCCAAHDNLQAIEEGTKLIDKMKTLGCDFVALGAPPPEYRDTAENFRKVIRLFNEQGPKFLEAGVKLAYHNHDFEFEKLEGLGGKTMLEAFYDETDAKTVFAEIDMYWVSRGSGSPTRWVRKVAGRMPVAHFKDGVMYQGKNVFCEVGEGNLDWPEVIRTCEETGVRWYSIEQDQPFPNRNIFDSIKMSFDNLRKLGVK